MSAKNFKRARQIARKLSAGKPANGLVGIRMKSRRRGESITAVVAPGTTRHIYKQIKLLMRRGVSIAQIEANILAGMKQNGNPT